MCSKGSPSSSSGRAWLNAAKRGWCGFSTGPMRSTVSSCTCMSVGQGGSAYNSVASSPGLRGSSSPSLADSCRRSSGSSRLSRSSRGMNQRASRLPGQPSTNGASIVCWRSSVQLSRNRANASPAASRNRSPASVSFTPRPSLLNSATPRSSSSRRICRLTAPWVTLSSAAAWLTLCRRAAASKARSALSGGSAWRIGEFS